MQQEQIILYLRENIVAVAMWAGGIVLFIWLLILFQVTRTRREVHQICKKIRKYFEVILAEDTQEAPPAEEAVAKEEQEQKAPEPDPALLQETLKDEADAKLLMEVISEMF